MIELLADPTSAPLWGIFLMAFGMYPFGLMLGAPCSPCCGCALCTGGSVLPETITVTFSGFTDKSQGPYLCDLEFSACYGSGANGVVTAPGGDPATDKGSITTVSLSDGGAGYAKLGRTTPTVTATGGGSGATLTVTLSQAQDECKVDYWKVKSIAGNGGTGYTDDEQVQFTVASGDAADEHATARIRTAREEPEVTLGVSTAQGSGAELEAVFTSLAGLPATWGIDSVTVVDGGVLYARGDMVTVAVKSQTTEVAPATLTINVTHVEPTVTASIPYSAGTGASLTANLSPITSPMDGANVWEVASVTVDAAGSGYEVYDTVLVAVYDGSPNSFLADAYVGSVDQNGGILSVTVQGGGEYFKGAPIDSVTVNDGGQYFKNSGAVDSVEVDTGGVYYREDASLTPYVANVTVTINQTLPSAGAGASISATVDSSTSSPTFGEITTLTIGNGGDDYLAWQWETNDCCGHWLNDKPIVLALAAASNSPTGATSVAGQSISGKCLYRHLMCGGWSEPFTVEPSGITTPANIGAPRPSSLTINVGFDGEGRPAVAEVETPNTGENFAIACGASWTGGSPIESCVDFSWSATDNLGRSITVEPGGEYDPEFQRAGSCSPCCQGYEPHPEEIEVVVADIWQFPRPEIQNELGQWVQMPDRSGTYVLANNDANFMGSWVGGGDRFGVIASIGFGVGALYGQSFPAPFNGCYQPPCSACIKKCAVFALPFVTNTSSSYWFYDEQAFCSEQFGGPGCDDCFWCEPTPICSPSGKTFNIWVVPAHAVNVAAQKRPAFTLTFQ